jgi:predicted DNA-binding transcriptional regulator AlpA
MTDEKKVLTEREVESEYGLSRPWLRKHRARRDGPPFLKLSRMVRYSRADVESWLGEHAIGTRDPKDRR